MTGIQGLDKVIYSKVPDHWTIMVEGDTGSLKTTLALEAIKDILSKSPEKTCIYFSLKEDANTLKHRFGLGEYIDRGQLEIIDYETLFDVLDPALAGRNILKGITRFIMEKKEKSDNNLSLVAFDPFNVLLGNIPIENLRMYLYHFFSNISEMNTQNWVVTELLEQEPEIDLIQPCLFLSDGIIELGMVETQDDIIRYLEIKKMRGVKHSLKRFQISYKKDELRVIGPTYES